MESQPEQVKIRIQPMHPFAQQLPQTISAQLSQHGCCCMHGTKVELGRLEAVRLSSNMRDVAELLYCRLDKKPAVGRGISICLLSAADNRFKHGVC